MIHFVLITVVALLQVRELLSSDDVCVDSEETMFEAMLHWVRHSIDERKKHIAKLLLHIRLCHMEKEVKSY